ncbi:B12-binding domain-containing radical SAM protein [Candidatus Woesearchaeota archaeon]|nr:B12-binding domain-containing radical SAM protein [Candidatus Woesearchaeota archaeon]
MKNNIKIVLVSLNYTSRSLGSATPSTALAYLSTFLRKKGYDVSCIDINHFKEVFDYLREKNITKAIKRISKKVSSLDPFLVGISSFSSTITFAMELAKEIKLNNKSIYTVLGGVGAATKPELILRECENLDFIIKGDGDSFPLLINSLFQRKKIGNVSGVCYIKNGKYIKNNDLSVGKEINNTIFDYESFIELQRITPGITTSRGCMFKCSYCSVNVVHTKCFQLKSDIVLKQVNKLINMYSPKNLLFQDDSLLNNKIYFKKLISKLPKNSADFALYARLDQVNHEIIKDSYDSNFHKIMMGIESFNPINLAFFNKSIPLEKLFSTLNLLDKFNFKTELSFIIGTPYDTKESLEIERKEIEKIKMNHSSNVKIEHNILIAYPGTKLWNMYENKEISLFKAFDIFKKDEKLSKYSSNPFFSPFNFVFENKKVPSHIFRNYLLEHLREISNITKRINHK